VRFELNFIFPIIRHELGRDRPVSFTKYGKKTVKRKWKKQNYNQICNLECKGSSPQRRGT